MGSSWRSSWDKMFWRTRGAETLRTVWFREPGAPKPYAQYGLGPRGAVEVCLFSIWHHCWTYLMIYSWFAHGLRMVFAWWDRDLCPVPLFQAKRISFYQHLWKHINILRALGVQRHRTATICSWFTHGFRMVCAWWDRDMCPVAFRFKITFEAHCNSLSLLFLCRSLKTL